MSTCLAPSAPPDYSTPLPPTYTLSPSCLERRVQYRPPSQPPAPTGTFVKKTGDVTIVLHGQKNDATCPCYSKGATIEGNVLLDGSVQTIEQVTILFKGTTKLDVGATKSIRLFSESTTLWSRESPCTSASSSPASVLPFTFKFPTHFHAMPDTETPLPPSFEAEFLGLNPLSASVKYQLVVILHKSKSRLSRHISIPWPTRSKAKLFLHYAPRTYPSRAILAGPSFLSILKSMPDEWFQASNVLRPNPWLTEMSNLEVNFFIPGSRIFGLSDRIPFHVQLSGSLLALQKLLALEPEPPVSSNDFKGPPAVYCAPYELSVSLLRRISITAAGFSQRHTREMKLGSAQIVALPGAFDGSSIHVDWEGSVQVDSSLAPCLAVGFSAAGLTVQDFMVLEINAPCRGRRPFQESRTAIPMRFTTESWYDDGEYLIDL